MLKKMRAKFAFKDRLLLVRLVIIVLHNTLLYNAMYISLFAKACLFLSNVLFFG